MRLRLARERTVTRCSRVAEAVVTVDMGECLRSERTVSRDESGRTVLSRSARASGGLRGKLAGLVLETQNASGIPSSGGASGEVRSGRGGRFASGGTSLSAAELIFDRDADRESERSQEECFVPSRHLRLSPTLVAPAAHSGASGAGIQASSDDVEERFPVLSRCTNQKDGCPGG